MLNIFRKNPSNSSDEELVTRFKKSGNMELLGILFERHTSLIYGVCLKVLKSEAEAEDAYMDIFEKLSKKVRQHDIQEFRPWLHVVVRNHCLEVLRKNRKHLTVSYDKEFMQLGEEMHPFMEDLSEMQLEALEHCMEELKVQQKECVNLFYLKGKSYKDIAALKEMNIGKIRSFIQNGRRNLGICMEKKGTMGSSEERQWQ